jgi:hypothetical protein
MTRVHTRAHMTHVRTHACRYRNLPTPPTPPSTYIGCYVDHADYDLPVSATKSLDTPDPVGECSLLCANYKYFALEVRACACVCKARPGWG